MSSRAVMVDGEGKGWVSLESLLRIESIKLLGSSSSHSKRTLDDDERSTAAMTHFQLETVVESRIRRTS